MFDWTPEPGISDPRFSGMMIKSAYDQTLFVLSPVLAVSLFMSFYMTVMVVAGHFCPRTT